MMQIRPEHGAMKPHWGLYFSVGDVDAAAAKATKLGGTVCVQPMDIPDIGRFAGIVSPQGIAFYVGKFIPPAT